MPRYFPFILFFLSYNISAQDIPLDKLLPVDKQITSGILENGIKYYIRQNEKPENRAELRLVVNAGSVLEDDDQRGLAHFVEHMAFNGTVNFEKHEIINYLESIGMRFGPDINAYTSFDETVYMLQVPTDSQQVLEKGITILKEWASEISLEESEIDKERGVIIEEWRLGRGAYARMLDKQFPVLLRDSRYAERLPIGKKEILENFSYETIKKFYKDWYRPGLMAVIAVGDFDPVIVEEIIKQTFSAIPEPEESRERTIYGVPDHKEILFAVATDPEAVQSYISIYFKHDADTEKTVLDYRELIIENLYNSMFNARLQELAQKPEPPFLYAYSSGGEFVRSKIFYSLFAGVKEENIEQGLEALLSESERVRKFGFTEPELQRQKAELLAYMEQAYNERDKTESDRFADEYVRNYLTGEPIPGIEFEYQLYKMLVPGITLEDLNSFVQELLINENIVVTVNAPEKESLQIPGEAELRRIVEETTAGEVEPYEDQFSNIPLLEEIPAPAGITGEMEIEAFEANELKLSNGVRVILKPTDFKNDEVLFHGFSPGGTSLIPLEEYIPAVTASAIINQSGAGEFDMTGLQKALAGKIVNVNPYINELSEGITGSAAPKDLETLFQLIYLYFTSPRADSSAYQTYLERIRSYLLNKNASPEAAFQDTVQSVFSAYHPRSKPWTTETLEKMDLQKSFSIYKKRFADASDFTFTFVGSFNPDSIKKLIRIYLGSLPSINREEKWKDPGIDPPEGIIEKTVRKGIEPKSRVNLFFTGDFNWTYQNRYELISMNEVLRIKLREILREDKGGTYGAGSNVDPQKYPDEEYSVMISFGCDPERTDELVETVFMVVDTLKSRPVDQSYVNKIKEIQRREWEVNLKNNNYWLGVIHYYYFYELDTNEFTKYPRRIENINAEIIRETAEKYLNTGNYIKVVLMPENETEIE